MTRILRTLFILLIIVPGHAYGTTNITPPKIDKNYQIPDHSAQAKILLKRFNLLKQHSRKLDRGERLGGDVDDLLQNLFLPESPQQFRNNFSREISIAKQPKKANLWRSLAQHYMNTGQHDDAATAAFMAYKLEKNPRRQANALALMGEIYVERGKLADGLNIINYSLRLHRTDDTQRRLNVIKERFFLVIRDISVNVEQAIPNACIIFSKDLNSGQHAEDYVTVTGLSDIDISAKANQICLNGLDYGKTYEVTIRKGLKGAAATILDQDSIRKFTVNDRQSRASFEGGSYVVSRTKDNMVPLTTVNMDKLELSLYLIHDRGLIHGSENDFLGNINNYQGDVIKNEKGSLIWRGGIDIKGDRNTEVRTLIPLKDMITETARGVYVLIARQQKKESDRDWRYNYQRNATQWLLISDMGLMTFRGKDGLHVMVRSLKSAGPVKNVKVSLIARNNKILGTATSDRRGLARFPMGLVRGKGGDMPVMITADIDQDYNFLKLENSYLDLSERGVMGRAAPGKQDAFLYTDRGVYRPGEMVKLSALLRSPESRAISNLPIKFQVRKPDGSLLLEKTVTGDDLGGYGFDIAISPSAIPGHYTVISSLAKKSLGEVSFQVEDFVPQRIRARLKSDVKWLDAATKAEFTLKANFLYGPPATGLKSETHITLRQNFRPYADYKDYYFGLVEEEFYAKSLSPVEIRTDDQGKAVIPLDLTELNDHLADTSQPILAYLQSHVFDIGGRPVDAKIALPLRLRDVEVGLKKSFTGSLSDGDEATFDIIALDKQGVPVKGRVISYELVREDYYYSWYRSGDHWNNRRHITDSMVKTGEVVTDSKGRAQIKNRAGDGRYRLNILDRDASSAASQRYYVGWWSSGSLPNVPDELELSLKDNSVNDGEVIRAFVKAPFAGRATIMVMNDRLRLSREISLPRQGREIAVKVDRAWGPGAYLMVTAFRPEAGKISKLPVRAMNLSWFSIDKELRHANIELTTPQTVIPRQTVTLPVTIKGTNISGQKIRLTVAAVDEGILGLTKFTSPDPSGHFLSQRRLGMTLADLYGRLIKPVDGLRGKLRTGGDMMARGMMAERVMVPESKVADENVSGVQTKTVKTVALYQRDIQLDKEGKGNITLDLPDFNGRLRLMVVGYGKDIVAQGDDELIVRDPVVADLLLPRFLSPGDRALTTLSLHNLSGRERHFTVDLNSDQGLDLSGETSIEVPLANGERYEKIIALKAGQVGDSKLSLVVKTAGLPDIKRHWDIAVRPAQPHITKRQLSYLAPGDHEVISREDINGFLPGTVVANVTLADRPDFNVPDLLDSLYLYPYGCGEQTTSRAVALLYFGDVAQSWDRKYDPLKIRRIIDKAILRLLDLQKHDGSFAAWRSTGATHPWLTAYIFEFLSRAKEQNMDVPAAAYDHARSWLKSYAGNRRNFEPHIMAYVQYVLARIGDITPGSIRYFADNQGRKIQTRIGLGHLAAALDLIGEKTLSDEYFEKALKTYRGRGSKWNWYKDYGSDLRDGAALAALIAEASDGDMRQLRIAEALDREFDRRKYFSTQEQAWLLLATHSMSKGSKPAIQVALNGKPLAKSSYKSGAALRYSLKPQAIRDGFDIENIGTAPFRAIQSIRGVPAQPLKPAARGFEISRSFFTLDGRTPDLSAIKQHDLLVVVIEGRSLNNIDHEGLIVDLLPAGFEIENAAIGGFEGQDTLKFIPRKSHFLYEAARDDRYVAAMDLGRYNRKFATSYIVRAVTPGTYSLPAVFVEDMYKPQYHARGAVGSVTIVK